VCFPFISGFTLAYLCAPLVDSISKYLNRTLVSLVLSICFICIFILAGMEFLPRLKEHLILIANNIPTYYDRFVSFLNDTFSSLWGYNHEIKSLKLEIQKYLDQKIYIFASIMGEIASKREAITGFLSFLIITPISFFYFLRDWNDMTNYVYDCIPHRQKNTLFEASNIVRRTFINFFHGQFYVATILFAYYALLLSVIKIDNYVYLGILSGLFSFIPSIGAVFSCILVILVSIFTLTTTKLYMILAIYVVGQFTEGYILFPKFVGKRTGLHPLWILFSFLAGIQLWGITGVLIAIPSAAIIRNLTEFALRKFKASQSYKQ
jgi:predicted PurR-regulated permease PerM